MQGDLLQKMIKKWSRKTATNVKILTPQIKRGTLRERERERDRERERQTD